MRDEILEKGGVAARFFARFRTYIKTG